MLSPFNPENKLNIYNLFVNFMNTNYSVIKILKSDLFVPFCGLLIGVGLIFQSRFDYKQWQKDNLLFLGVLLLVLDIFLLMLIIYKKNSIQENKN
jgi:hypothetical protein